MFPRHRPTVDASLTTAPVPGRPARATAKAGNRLTTTVLVSAGLHVVAVVAALLLLRGVPVAIEAEKPAEVELVMEERKGDLGPSASPAATPSPARQDPAPPRDRPAPTADKAPATENTPDQDPGIPPADQAETAAPPTPSPPTAKKIATDARTAPPPKPETPPPAPPAKTAEQVAPKISLSGTDSPSDARAYGSHVIPAAPDAVFHNRPPEYPMEAQAAGEHGTVVLVVHVSPAGRAAGVDVLRSSGFIELDQSARDAVSRWRFLPPVQAGRTIAGAMTISIVFGDE